MSAVPGVYQGTLGSIMEMIRAFDSMCGGRRNWHGFLLEHGRAFEAQVLPSRYARMTPKACFQNALQLAERHPDLIYVEGYADRVMPIHHAWCAAADGRVIDPTWERPEEGAYFGIPFRTAFVQRETDRSGSYGIMTNPSTVARVFRFKPTIYLRRIP